MCVGGFVLRVFTFSPGGGETSWGLDGCQEDDSSHRQLSINRQRRRRTHNKRHTDKVFPHISLTHSIRSSSSSSSRLLSLLDSVQGELQWSVAEYKTLQRQTNGNHTSVLRASHGCVLLDWKIRPRLGLLAGDLRARISFMKRRGHKDDLFFLSPFLSLSLAPLPPSLLPQLADLSSSLRGIYQTRMRTCTCDGANTHGCKNRCAGTVLTRVKGDRNKDKEGETWRIKKQTLISTGISPSSLI